MFENSRHDQARFGQNNSIQTLFQWFSGILKNLKTIENNSKWTNSLNFYVPILSKFCNNF